MRKIILVVASALALGAATMTTGALAQRSHGTGMDSGAHFTGGMSGGPHFNGGMSGGPHFNGGMGGGAHFGARFGGGHFGGETHFGRDFKHRDFDHRFAFRHRFFRPGVGFFAVDGSPWGWDGDDCLSRWERTPSGWRQRLC
jgi:hypothetical protein